MYLHTEKNITIQNLCQLKYEKNYCKHIRGILPKLFNIIFHNFIILQR